MVQWLNLTCSYCAAKFRIKEEYAHLRGRCPACGFRIAAPRNKAYEPPDQTSDSDEPLGLVPVDEEWPEPARLEERDERTVYGMSALPRLPVQTTLTPQADEPDPVYQLAKDKPYAPAPPPPAAGPVVTPYQMSGKLGEAPPMPPPPSPPPSLASPPPRVEVDELPVVALATTEAAATPPATSAAPAPSQPSSPPAEPPRQPANIIDELFMDSLPPVAPAIHVDAAPDIPVAEFALPDTAEPPAPAPQQTPKTIPMAKLAPPLALPAPPSEALEKKRKKEPPPKKPEPPDENESSEGSPPSDASYTYQLNPAELAPIRATAPRRPFAEGVFGFPLRPNSMGPFLWIAVGLTILSIQGRLIMVCLSVGPWGVIGAGAVGLSMLWVILWTGSYSAACFFNIVQETAAGADDVSWPEGSWRDWFFPLLRLAWIGLCAGLICGLFALIFGWTTSALLFGPPLFLVMLLSSMAGDSWFTLLDSRVLGQLGKRFLETAGVLAGSMILFALTVGAAIGSVFYLWFLAPLTGFVGAWCYLLYGRLVGRLAWLLTEDERKKKRKKKKKRLLQTAAKDAEQSKEPVEEKERVAESDWG